MSGKKSRGRYKQYLHNLNVKVPPNTFYRNKRDTLVDDSNQNVVNFDTNLEASPIVSNVIMQENSLTHNTNHEFIFETNNAEPNNEQINENLDILNDIVNENPLYDNQSNFDAEELNTLFDKHEITAEELASAYLVAFFNGSITQKVYVLN